MRKVTPFQQCLNRAPWGREGAFRGLPGPPWGLSLGDLERALASDFLLRAADPAERSIPERSWGEELAVFERAANG